VLQKGEYLLRATPDADAWVRQFDAKDRSTAAFLLEHLILISHSQFQNGLFSLMRHARASANRPIPLFAAREADEDEEVDQDEVAESPQSAAATLTVPTRDTLYFDPTNAEVRPNAVGHGAGIGSEGIVAGLIRDIVNQDGTSAFLDHPSIHSMRSVKSREVFLVDDVIGSGKRMMDFIDAFVRHKTIKSWHSRDHLRLTILAFAGTAAGIKQVESHHYVSKVICARVLPYGGPLWSSKEREDVEELCREYSRRTNRWKIPLGYRGALTLLAFEHKCPNTAPPILWSDSRKNGWKALFRKRPGTGFSRWPEPIDEKARTQELLKRIGQDRLAETAWQMHVQPEGRFRLLILAAAAKRLTRPSILTAIVGVTHPHLMQLLDECVKSGWLTSGHRITQQGLNELAAARKLGLTPSEAVELCTDFYFPRSLRATRDSI